MGKHVVSDQRKDAFETRPVTSGFLIKKFG